MTFTVYFETGNIHDESALPLEDIATFLEQGIVPSCTIHPILEETSLLYH